jgi:hypothetical protein
MKPTFDQMMSWQRQIVEDQCKWHEGHIDPKRLADFREGMKQGMRALWACLRRHGVLPEA